MDMLSAGHFVPPAEQASLAAVLPGPLLYRHTPVDLKKRLCVCRWLQQK